MLGVAGELWSVLRPGVRVQSDTQVGHGRSSLLSAEGRVGPCLLESAQPHFLSSKGISAGSELTGSPLVSLTEQHSHKGSV